MFEPSSEALESARSAWFALADEYRRAAQSPEAALGSREARARLEQVLESALRALGASLLEASLASGPAPVEAADEEPLNEPTPAPAALDEPPSREEGEPTATFTIEPAAAPSSVLNPPATITPEVLARLQLGMSSGKALEPRGKAAAEVDEGIARRIVALAKRPPRPPATADECAADAEQLQKAITLLVESHPRERELNHRLTSFLTLRARALQKQLESLPRSHPWLPLLEKAIQSLSQHSKRTQPGFIFGLALNHRPKGASWWSEAGNLEAKLARYTTTPEPAVSEELPADLLRRLVDDMRVSELPVDAFLERARSFLRAGGSAKDTRLARLAVRYLPELEGHPDLKKLKAAARRAAEEEWDANGESPPTRPALPADWPHRTALEGRSAIIVGGERRPERAEELQAFFGFSRVEWMDGGSSGIRHLDAVEERIRNGSIDYVIVLRAFSSHKLADRIFGAKVPESCVRILADTYGVLQVRLGFERYLGSRNAR